MSDVNLTGYASVFNSWYPVGPYQERIAPGAFRASLANPALDCVLRIEHKDLPLARTSSGTLTLTEDDRGLRVAASLDGDDPDVQRVVPKIKRGDLAEMSFAFRSTDDEWSSDYRQRTVRSADVHRGDVAVVTYGASPTTSLGLRAHVDDGTEARFRQARSLDNPEQRAQAISDLAWVETRGQVTGIGGSTVRANTKKCSLCGGTGRIRANTTKCPACRGSGVVQQANAAPDHRVARTRADGTMLEAEFMVAKRRRAVTERDRAEFGWQARQQAPSSPLSEGEILRLLTSRSYADQERGAAEMRRRRG